MSQESQDTFVQWLDKMEDKKGWTDYRLSAETGLSSSVFSKARQGLLPKWEALVRIATAFNISPIHASAQACHNYCISQGAGDIHGLDKDRNGSACESLP